MNHDPMSRATPLGAAADRRTGVGGLLRASRLRCGEELDDIAQSLRIRRRHLLAIEEGEFEQLPGTTYAVGFIRAYADYLGLDSDEVVRRFKEEQAIDTGNGVRARKSELVFPAPMAESGVPRGAVVFLGVVIGLIAYGGWYVSTVDNDFFKRWIEPVPSRLAALLPGGEGANGKPNRTQAIAADRPAVKDETAEAAQPEAARAEAAKAEGIQAEPVQAVETAALPAAEPAPATDPSAAPQPADAQPASPSAVQTAPETTSAPASSPAAAAPGTPAAAPAPEAATPAGASQPSPRAEAAPSATPSATPSAAPTEVASVPSVEGARDARIMVTATSDSWVEIREQATDAWVWGKLLRTGESYGVPDRMDLKMKTGNAGGLTITVDGRQVPSVGTGGEVVRNVALDPERLKAGTAVAR